MVWLATHRRLPKRTGARGALWNFEIRETPFRNVVSDLRRTLSAAAPPPEGTDWLECSVTELLPLHSAIQSDAGIVQQAVAWAALRPANERVEVLEPAADLIEGMPFAGTSYLWPDAEGLTGRLVVLATEAMVMLATAHLESGNPTASAQVAERGLSIFSGHEGLVGIGLQALAALDDSEGFDALWTAYEETLCDDAWGPHEPSQRLVALRAGAATIADDPD